MNGKYPNGSLTTVKYADTIQTTLTSGGFTKTYPNGHSSEFAAAQFHMHSPSEHTVDGKFYDMELHVVHAYAEGGLGGVLGVFFDRSAGNIDNPFLDKLPASLFTSATAVDDTEVSDIDVNSWLESIDKAHWNYSGSLTTPPCTEGIKWTVFSDVQPISDAQLKKFTDLWESTGNNRLV